MAHIGLTAQDPYPVRVWMGYALERYQPQDGRNDLYQRLGSVFIPATVQMMQPLGLTAYLPTVMPVDADPAVPDEIALVFYETRAVYQAACQDSVGGRAYAMLHETVFNFSDSPERPKSHSGFPERFQGAFGPEFSSSYSLFDEIIDWQKGKVGVLVGVDSGVEAETFTTNLIRLLNDLGNNPPTGLDGAVFTLFRGCLVFWSHWREGSSVRDDLFSTLPGMRIILAATAKNADMPLSLDDDYAGISVIGGDSLNFQFRRRADG